MPQNPTSDASPANVLRILCRHERKVGVFVLAMLGVTAGIILFAPRKYGSESRLFVRVGRETVALDPTATTGQTVGVVAHRENEINSVKEILRSRGMASKVVDILGPDVILDDPDQSSGLANLTEPLSRLKLRLLPPGPDAAETRDRRDSAIKSLRRQIEVSSARNAAVITVATKARSPELAQRILATLVEAYRDEHIRLNRTAGSEEFFEEQQELVAGRLAKTQDELRDLKNEVGFVSIEGQRALLEEKTAEIAAKQLEVGRELASSIARHHSLEQSVGDMEAIVATERIDGRPHYATDGMRQQLYELEIKERELREVYDDDHPLLRAFERQVANVRKIQAEQDEFRTESTFATNPTRQKLMLDLHLEASRLASLQATHESIQQQDALVLAELRQLNTYAVRIEDLQRHAELLEQSYRTYAESYEQARIDAALQQERITNVNVVQAATLEPRPVSPNKKVVASMGLLAAVFGGLGLALAAENFDSTLKSPGEVEAALALPVVMSIPRSSRQCVHV